MSDEWVSLGVNRNVRERVRDLVAKISAAGWKSVGADRTDAPTLTAVVDYAIGLVETWRTRKEKRPTKAQIEKAAMALHDCGNMTAPSAGICPICATTVNNKVNAKPWDNTLSGKDAWEELPAYAQDKHRDIARYVLEAGS